jgi:hypothetical protein
MDMVDVPVDFKKFAEDCLRLAMSVQGTEDKAALLKMGEVWVRLAEHYEVILALISDTGSKPPS